MRDYGIFQYMAAKLDCGAMPRNPTVQAAIDAHLQFVML